MLLNNIDEVNIVDQYEPWYSEPTLQDVILYATCYADSASSSCSFSIAEVCIIIAILTLKLLL